MTYESLSETIARYPYFAYAALRAIPLAPDAETRSDLKAIVAANVGSETDLREILHLNSESLADFYPDSLPPQLSTEDTIDSFLNHFGTPQAAQPGPISTPPSSASPIPVTPAVDYTSMLESQPPIAANDDDAETPVSEADSTSGQLNAIDAFLQAVPPARPRTSQPDPTTPPSDSKTESFTTSSSSPQQTDISTQQEQPSAPSSAPQDAETEPLREQEDTSLTESFARILIKNHNYAKALEIIEDLNLKNPEKSIYFADQIRFLKKLIINQSKK